MRLRFALWILPVALLVGCSATSPTTAPSRGSAPDAPQSTAETSELEALYWKRIESNKTYTQADVDYMTGMIGHHAQALIMSDMAPRNGASPGVLRLAARIENAQNDEIESMQRWLRDRGQPVPTVEIDGTLLTIRMVAPEESADGAMGDSGMERGAMDHENMDHGEMDHDGTDHSDMNHGEMDHDGGDHVAGGHGGMGDHSHANMPGMLTQAQLDELNEARGAHFDRLFLTYMIAHHGGAVTMTDDLFTKDGAAQDDTAFKLASDIQVDQRTEIARMQTMLDALPDSD